MRPDAAGGPTTESAAWSRDREATRGKGDHATLYYGDRFTIVGDQARELKSGTMHAMPRQLGLTLADLEG